MVNQNVKIVRHHENVGDKKLKYQFIARTDKARNIKIIFEILSYYLKTVCSLRITPEGVFICEESTDGRVILQIALESSKFALFSCRKSRTINISIDELYSTLKPAVRKDDKVTMCITNEDPDTLTFVIVPTKSMSQSTRVSTPVTEVTREFAYKFPTDYTNPPVIISPSDMQKMCQGMKKLNDKIVINCDRPRRLRMICTGINGTVNDTTSEYEDDEHTEEELAAFSEFNGTFCTRDIIKAMKLVNLGDSVSIETAPERHFKMEIRVSSMGKCCVFLLSNEQIQAAINNESDDESDSSGDETD